MFVRRDIWALEEEHEWHPITEAYSFAIDAMQRRAASDPTGWVYQAAVHAVGFGGSPDAFRDQCQHACWFFLPWHRMYLYWFERIVRAAVVAHPHVSDDVKNAWALPYWDYGRDGKYAALPPAFREPLHNGDRNPLYVSERNPIYNDQGGQLPPQMTSARLAMAKRSFAASISAGQSAAFGGPVTGWHHDPDLPFGALEQTPHNNVHSEIGGRDGFMAAFDTAPLDPVFWLHHANIDRLWTAWLAQPNRANPGDPAWLDMQFEFHDEAGGHVTSTPGGVLDTGADLGYTYPSAEAVPEAPAEREVERPGVAEAPVAAGEAAVPPAQPPVQPPGLPPELVGATDAPVALEGRTVTVALDVTPPVSPHVASVAEADRSVYLNVEGITGDRNPGTSYGVYLNLPSGSQGAAADEHHVGNLSFFGIERVGDTARDHSGGHGLHHAYNITDLVAELKRRQAWDPDRLSVTFLPLRPVPPEGHEGFAEPDDHETVTIGRVSLFVQ
jgi:tyrosinase